VRTLRHRLRLTVCGLSEGLRADVRNPNLNGTKSRLPQSGAMRADLIAGCGSSGRGHGETPKVTCNLAHRWMPRKQPHHGHRRGSRARKARPKTEARVPENDAMEIDHVAEPEGRSRVAEDGPDQATRTTLGNPSENPCWNPSRKWEHGRSDSVVEGCASGGRLLGTDAAPSVGGWCPAPLRHITSTPAVARWSFTPPPCAARRAGVSGTMAHRRGTTPQSGCRTACSRTRNSA